MSSSLPPAQFAHFTRWLHSTPLGEYVLTYEQAWFDSVTADIFGYQAMQLQLSQINFLRANRIPSHIFASEEDKAEMRCCPYALPIANQSLDLLILPHGLDFTTYPQEVLREAYRVLVPEGRLLITGFNPYSLWLWRYLFKRDPWQTNRLTLPRLKDWLTLLGFESMQGGYLGYTLPVQDAKWLTATRWMDAVGDRWWPLAGSIYCLDMIKRIQGMRMIMPAWREAIQVKNAVAASKASCKVSGHE